MPSDLLRQRNLCHRPRLQPEVADEHTQLRNRVTVEQVGKGATKVERCREDASYGRRERVQPAATRNHLRHDGEPEHPGPFERGRDDVDAWLFEGQRSDVRGRGRFAEQSQGVKDLALHTIERRQCGHDRIRSAGATRQIVDRPGWWIGQLGARHQQTGQLLIAQTPQRIAQSGHTVEATRLDMSKASVSSTRRRTAGDMAGSGSDRTTRTARGMGA